MTKEKLLQINVIFFSLFFLYFNVPIWTKISFFLVFLSILYFTYYILFKEKTYSPFFSTFIIFELLFFIVAPIIQIDRLLSTEYSGIGRFVQYFPFDESIIIRANAYVLIFNFVFFVSYVFLKKLKKKEEIKKTYTYTQTPLFLFFLVIIVCVIVLININGLIFQYGHEFLDETAQTSIANYLIVQKLLYFFPVGGIILAFNYLEKSKIKNKNYYFVLFAFFLLLIIILILKNPLTEKRNALGPLYILLFYIFYKRFLDTTLKVYKFMLFSMVFVFPLASILTHSRYSLAEMVEKPVLIGRTIKYLNVSDAFNSLHYDAYANFLATIDYCDHKEIVYGKQLSCSVLFFVPRGVWRSKPETTGMLIGDYLIEKYDFFFNNLSNPFISEGYINFGFLGLFIFPFLLALLMNYFMRWLESGDILKSMFAFYFSIYLMFFLRGDLTNGIAFIVGFYLAVVLFPKYFISLINYAIKK